MKKLQLLFAFLAHTQVSVVLHKRYYRMLLLIRPISLCVCVCVVHMFSAEGGIRSQELLGSISASVVQCGLSAGLFRVPQIPSRQVHSK